MAGTSGSLHEAPERLDPATIDRHRAIVSLMEELEAVDWYDQRLEATSDDELRGILEHNRDEEKEHAAMVLEWLRRNDARMDEELRTYLFRDGPIMHGSEAGNDADAAPAEKDGSLGIGSLKGQV
jgi:uncharacterized protein